MPEPIASPQEGELFPDLKGKPFRTFTETGWGRFPLPLLTAGLKPVEFAVYVRISVFADTGEDVPPVEGLAAAAAVTVERAQLALDRLLALRMLIIQGESWTLTEPAEWLL